MCMEHCDGCIYNDKEYIKALEKAKANNPYIFEEQEKMHKIKLKHSKIYNLLNKATLLPVIVGVILCTYCLLFSNEYFSLSIGLLFVLIVISTALMMTIEHNNSAFWSQMANTDYWLYNRQKEELKKAGYELP